MAKHVCIDIHKCLVDRLKDEKIVYDYLDDAVKLLGMKKVFDPWVYKFEVGGEGITGFVVIETSHLSFHSYPEEGFAYIDIFSCADFALDTIINHTIATFLPSEIKQWTVPRHRLSLQLQGGTSPSIGKLK